jgi:hypothetical protein
LSQSLSTGIFRWTAAKLWVIVSPLNLRDFWSLGAHRDENHDFGRISSLAMECVRWLRKCRLDWLGPGYRVPVAVSRLESHVP